MDAKWVEQFEDFGVDCYLPYPRSSLQWISLPENWYGSDRSNEERIAFLKQSVSTRAPRSPGVYGMIDASGRLVYVGKSKAIRNRLLSYFLPNNEEDKSGRIAQTAHQIVWENQPNEFAALLREQCLIRRWLPQMNVVGMPKRQKQAFLCLGKPPGDSFYLSRYHDSTAKVSVGPISGVAQLNRGIEILTRHFRLRDCSQKTKMAFSDQLTLFDLDHRAGCVRHELGTCIAPCLPGSSRESYDRQVAAAVDYLKTGDSDLPKVLEQGMERASAGRHYENAARLREDLRIIQWLSRKLASFQRARDAQPFVYSVPGVDDRSVWYLLMHGGVAGAVAAPRNGNEWRGALHRFQSWGDGSKVLGQKSLNPDDTLGLVTSWLQREKKLAAKVASNPDAAGPIPNAWFEPLITMPATWRDAKEWLKEKGEARV